MQQHFYKMGISNAPFKVLTFSFNSFFPSMLVKNSVKEVHILSTVVLSLALFTLCMDFLALMVQPKK